MAFIKALTKYIKAPIAGSISQYVDAELRKVAASLASLERELAVEIQEWTPTLYGEFTAGTATYTIREGIYYKQGNRVDFKARVAWSDHTGAGNFNMSGLPFVVRNDGALNSYWTVPVWSTISTLDICILGPVDNNLLRFYDSATNRIAVVASGQIILSGTMWI